MYFALCVQTVANDTNPTQQFQYTKRESLEKEAVGVIYVSRFSFRMSTYRKTSNISRTLEGNKIVDNSDAVGASPVGAAPTTSSFST